MERNHRYLKTTLIFLALVNTGCKEVCESEYFLNGNELADGLPVVLEPLLKNATVKFRRKNYPTNTKWKICVLSDEKISIESTNIRPMSKCEMENTKEVIVIECNDLK